MRTGSFWHRTFRRREWTMHVVGEAIREQEAFEVEHLVPYDHDQRITAVVQRAVLLGRAHGAKNPPEARIRAAVVEVFAGRKA